MKWFGLLFCLCPFSVSAQLQLAPIFSDNMVFQRGEPIRIWGKAAPGEKVTVRMTGHTVSVLVNRDSIWKISFSKQKANKAAQTVYISAGSEKQELKNILVGDVWLLSGQSNMEWPMVREAHWKNEKMAATQPLIRFNNPVPAGRYVYGVAYTDSLSRRLKTDSFYLWSSWQVSDSSTVKGLSAVGYYFAKSIVANTGVPIGLINLSIGGAPLETFISREALASDKRFAGKVQGSWLENSHLPAWVRERSAQNVAANQTGFRDEWGPNHAYKPGFAYEAGVKPLLSLSIKGVLWYQGESNSLEKDRVEEYKELMKRLIADYRKGWKKPTMPFYWVQLSSIDTLRYQSQYWPQFRDEQRKLLAEIKNGGMAVSSDIGAKYDVHPTNKRDIGERLARWARKKVHGEAIVPSGPLAQKAVFKNGSVWVEFSYADSLHTADKKALRGFSLDGITKAEAYIQNNKVRIPAAQKPDAVFYGWQPYTEANLVNAEGLPTSTFKLAIK